MPLRPPPPILALTLALAAIPLAGCGDGGRDPDDGRPVVAVSIAPQAGLVERIAGDLVRVVVLVEPGESPATYQPSDFQVSEIARARVYFRIGVPFENGKWLGALRSAAPDLVVSVTEGLATRRFEHEADHDDHDHEGADPHVWLDPSKLKVLASDIAAALRDIDPANAPIYDRNLVALRADLDALDREIRQILAPHRGRRVYVFHPSWGYFCDAYGLEQVAIEIAGKEPSESEITRLLERARADRIRVLYVQPQIRGASAEAVARALGCEVRVLDPLAREVIGNLRTVARTLAEGWR